MNQTYDLAVPLQQVKIQQFAKYRIQQVIVHLFSGCTITVSLLDANNYHGENVSLEMQQSDYVTWGEDDTYIVEWINARLQERYPIQ